MCPLTKLWKFHFFYRWWFDIWTDLLLANYFFHNLYCGGFSLGVQFFMDFIVTAQPKCNRKEKEKIKEKVNLIQWAMSATAQTNFRAIKMHTYPKLNKTYNNYGVYIDSYVGVVCEHDENVWKLNKRMGPAINFIEVYGHTNAMTSSLIRIHSL